MKPDISIILCTYNRADSLGRTLESLAQLKVPPGVVAELLLVDNNSTDHTREVWERARMGIGVRYICERKQGHNHALNRGLAEITAPLILFTDDDVDVDENWLAAYWSAAARNRHAGYFGGRILPRWEVPPPRWFAENSRTHLACVEVYFDQGASEREWNWSVVGANMAIRREALGDVRFEPSLGPDGTETIRCGEVELIAQLRRAGVSGWYVPEGLIHHRTPARRMTERYVRQWFKGEGIAEVRRGQIVEKAPWGGVPRYYWKVLVTSAARYGLTRWVAPASIWLPAEIAMAKAWGIITECRRRTDLGRPKG